MSTLKCSLDCQSEEFGRNSAAMQAQVADLRAKVEQKSVHVVSVMDSRRKVEDVLLVHSVIYSNL